MTYFVLSNLLYLFWWTYCPGLASVSLFSLVLPCFHRPPAVLGTLLHFFVTWQDVATLEPGIYPQELLASLIESSIYILALGVHIVTHVSLFLHVFSEHNQYILMYACIFIHLSSSISVCLSFSYLSNHELTIFQTMSSYPNFQYWTNVMRIFFKPSNFLYMSMFFSNYKWLIYHCLW